MNDEARRAEIFITHHSTKEMPKRETAKSTPASFEAQLASLERIVRELERGELPLEQSLELFEQGVKLSRECQERLNEAERRIEVLLRGGDGSTVAVPFESGGMIEDEDGPDDETVF
jgi:exodeoxyribonuclease VII small subunit